MKIQFLLKSTGMNERLGIMYMSSLAKRDGHQVRLLITGDLTDAEIVSRVAEFAPDIIGYSIMTGEHNYHLDLNLMLKGHLDFYAIFGGPHPTFAPQMIEKRGVDAICQGEGDIVFPKLLKRMETGEDYLDLPNFWFKKEDGSIIRNEIGPLLEDLDELPFPDRDLMYEADPAIATKSSKMVMAMRGCPFLCTYCFNAAYNQMTRKKGKMLRTRSVDNFIAELKEIQARYPIKTAGICDDTFVLKPAGWLEEFAEKLPTQTGLEFTANIRPNVVKPETARLLKKAGCSQLWMGVECGNNEIASKLLKRFVKNEVIEEAAHVLRENGLRFFSQNLIGLPVDDPLAVDLETLDFNIRLKPDFGWSSILYPYPETFIGKFAIEQGLFDSNFDTIQVSNKTTSALAFENPEVKRRIENLHKLFGLVVEFPILRPLVPFLIALPLGTPYTWLFFLFYGYKFVWQPQSWAERRESFVGNVRFFFKYVTGLERKHTFNSVDPPKRKPGSYPAAAAAE